MFPFLFSFLLLCSAWLRLLLAAKIFCFLIEKADVPTICSVRIEPRSLRARSGTPDRVGTMILRMLTDGIVNVAKIKEIWVSWTGQFVIWFQRTATSCKVWYNYMFDCNLWRAVSLNLVWFLNTDSSFLFQFMISGRETSTLVGGPHCSIAFHVELMVKSCPDVIFRPETLLGLCYRTYMAEHLKCSEILKECTSRAGSYRNLQFFPCTLFIEDLRSVRRRIKFHLFIGGFQKWKGLKLSGTSPDLFSTWRCENVFNVFTKVSM